MENKLELLTIYKLIEDNSYSFYIPSYQRGYRWTITQVTDLLDDIFEFSQKKEKTKDEFYCLQPVVVKPKNQKWEVIDGQQRLTTLYLLLKYFNTRLADDFRKPLYSIEYETRKNSGKYLDNISSDECLTNVDYFHIYQAYSTIRNWFSKRQNFVNEFEASLLNSTKIIWYEVNEDIDSVDIFTRLNIGKIPLTNSELIKALFLFRDNFKGESQTKLLRQLEIAGEWDRIEAILREPEFWGFISDGIKEYDNRIEFIFDLMSDKTNQDKDFTFRYFQKKFADIGNVEIAWKQVKDYFLTFQEWYNDRELFHWIGFLIMVGEKVSTLKSESGLIKSKTSFKESLKNKIKGHVKVQVSELSYLESPRKILRNVLLLFNIVSVVNNKNSTSKFQFGRYKLENWDIEHIHSVKSNMPERDEHQKDWLNDFSEFTEDETMKNRINTWLSTDRKLRTESFENIYDDILKKYSEEGKTEEIHDISNLTLLDAGTNRGYKNAIYPVKRKKIIQKDLKETFIPLCTKNAFLKYYNYSVSKMTIWDYSDRSSYLEAIIETLQDFLPIPQIKNIK